MISSIRNPLLRRAVLIVYLPLLFVIIGILGIAQAVNFAVRDAAVGASEGWDDITNDTFGLVRRTWRGAQR